MNAAKVKSHNQNENSRVESAINENIIVCDRILFIFAYNFTDLKFQADQR